MQRRPEIAGVCVASVWLGLFAVVASGGCKVYKRDLLEQTQAPEAGPMVDRDAAADSGIPGTDGVIEAGPVQPPFDPNGCMWGECWWSTGSVDTCRSAGLPLASDRPPGGDDTARVGDIYLGFTELRLGSTNRDGEVTDDAWQDFGFDLDGLCTNSSTCPNVEMQGCKSAVAAIPYDGQLCRDNTFARLQPVIAAVPELGARFGLGEEAFNCELWRGGWNVVVKISGYNGESNDPLVRLDYYQSTGIQETLPWTCPAEGFKEKYPRWLSSRKWGVVEAGLTGPIGAPGTLPNSRTADAEAYVKDGYLVARLPDDAEQGFIGNGTSYRGFKFKTQKSVYVGRLVKAQDGTWSIQDGLTSGRIRKTDLVQSFRDIGFCETGDLSTFYTGMLSYVDENADVLANGASDPGMDCDAMSYAFGFKAAQLLPGTAVVAPKLIECCEPGRTEAQCTAVCGDGQVSGDEKCDTTIAADQPGACPTSCAPTDACTPRTLIGSACTTECAPMPITMAGAADGCCPTGGNATSDRDCKPVCGNGVIETGETCDPKEACKACASSNPCAPLRPVGSADTCNLGCEPAPITQCRNGDNCCPATCSTNNDRDCSSNCGNSKIDNGETCEANTPTPCPANCDDGKACTKDSTTGSAANCNIVCAHADITQAANGDGCCPPSASSNNDNDCRPMCGNKVVEGDEQCDDGNTNAGDGCVDCRTETQQQICLVKLGSTDACAQCTCNKCTGQGLACYGANNAGDVTLCKNMVDCGRAENCGDPDCFCGNITLLLCLTGLANGECRDQVAAAAKTDSPLDIQARSADTNFPLGRANALRDCVDTNCRTECMR
jgi:cysteine-rich repeat protein